MHRLFYFTLCFRVKGRADNPITYQTGRQIYQKPFPFPIRRTKKVFHFRNLTFSLIRI